MSPPSSLGLPPRAHPRRAPRLLHRPPQQRRRRTPPGDEEEEAADLGSRYWLPSIVDEDALQDLEAVGYLPTREDCRWRAALGDIIPAPEAGERVILTSHLVRGMALPPSAFFSEVLDHYGLQPHNIAPNSILVLAGFTALFEGYLGIRPSLDFFRYCFRCRRQTVPDGGLATCGSVTFNCRQGRQWYPKIPYLESVKGWTSTFFYCQDMAAPGRQVGIPAFVNAPPMPRPCWDEAVPKLTEELRLFQRRIEFLTRTMAPPCWTGWTPSSAGSAGRFYPCGTTCTKCVSIRLLPRPLSA